MAKVNLLPWREALRQQRQRNFLAILALTAILAVVCVLAANQIMNNLLADQNDRNQFLRSEVQKLDREIQRIEELEEVRDGLISRKNVIERLQGSRSLMVHLFNQIAQTVPEGITLTNVRQSGSELTLNGTSQSETRVSDYIRQIEQATWLTNPTLRIIQADQSDERPDQPFRFELRAQVQTPGQDEEEF
ncbi:MAG: PilN domain-containing protein [Wenzhouxiangella sp.]|jgi:type IV pilus assembly protein PilN|nr:PilN domain-containing protein [Wenzhouxiangella sp.]